MSEQLLNKQRLLVENLAKKLETELFGRNFKDSAGAIQRMLNREDGWSKAVIDCSAALPANCTDLPWQLVRANDKLRELEQREIARLNEQQVRLQAEELRKKEKAA